MDRARRSLVRSAPSLWLIGVCVFLPMVRACEKMESPASLVRNGPVYFGALLAPLLVAELLAVVVIVGLASGRVSRTLDRLTLALVVAATPSPLLLAAFEVCDGRADEWAWAAFAIACFAAAVVVAWRARRQRDFGRQSQLVGAFALLALPLASFVARIVAGNARRDAGIGAWLFVAAEAALLAVHARWRRAAPVASSTE